LAFWASAPIDDLCFVDLEPGIVRGRQAGRSTVGAFDVDDPPTSSADQMVVVVADFMFEARRRSGRLDSPEQTLVSQDTEGVVDGLTGNGADLVTYGVRDLVGGAVGQTVDRSQDRQSLCRDLEAVVPE
jgi:hypothetical protein